MGRLTLGAGGQTLSQWWHFPWSSDLNLCHSRMFGHRKVRQSWGSDSVYANSEYRIVILFNDPFSGRSTIPPPSLFLSPSLLPPPSLSLKHSSDGLAWTQRLLIITLISMLDARRLSQ